MGTGQLFRPSMWTRPGRAREDIRARKCSKELMQNLAFKHNENSIPNNLVVEIV